METKDRWMAVRLRYDVQNLNVAYFKNLPYRTSVTYRKKKKKCMRADTYVLFIGWYALIGVARGGPGPPPPSKYHQ